MDRFAHSNAPVRKVKGLQFGILDPDYVVSLEAACTASRECKTDDSTFAR